MSNTSIITSTPTSASIATGSPVASLAQELSSLTARVGDLQALIAAIQAEMEALEPPQPPARPKGDDPQALANYQAARSRYEQAVTKFKRDLAELNSRLKLAFRALAEAQGKADQLRARIREAQSQAAQQGEEARRRAEEQMKQLEEQQQRLAEAFAALQSPGEALEARFAGRTGAGHEIDLVMVPEQVGVHDDDDGEVDRTTTGFTIATRHRHDSLFGQIWGIAEDLIDRFQVQRQRVDSLEVLPAGDALDAEAIATLDQRFGAGLDDTQIAMYRAMLLNEDLPGGRAEPEVWAQTAEALDVSQAELVQAVLGEPDAAAIASYAEAFVAFVSEQVGSPPTDAQAQDFAWRLAAGRALEDPTFFLRDSALAEASYGAELVERFADPTAWMGADDWAELRDTLVDPSLPGGVASPERWAAAADELGLTFDTLVTNLFGDAAGREEAVLHFGSAFEDFVGHSVSTEAEQDFGGRLVAAYLLQDVVGPELPIDFFFATDGPWNAGGDIDEAAVRAAVISATEIGTGPKRNWIPPVIQERGNGEVNRTELLTDPSMVGFSELEGLEGHYLATPAARQFEAMMAAAAADGVTITINSTPWLSYRSVEQQQSLWDNSSRPLSERSKWVARPGTSCHGLGLAVDIDEDRSTNNADYRTAYAWMKENAGRFGFVQPMSWEKWHWEFHPGEGGPFSRPLDLGSIPDPSFRADDVARVLADLPLPPAGLENGDGLGGNPNADVEQLQQVLIGLGVLEKGGADGAFGPKTQRAVETLQYLLTAIGSEVPVTGVYDDATRAALLELSGS